jgi:hypothetical protein
VAPRKPAHHRKYTATAIHAGASAKKSSEDMGFIEGWGMALDQLVEVAKSL